MWTAGPAGIHVFLRAFRSNHPLVAAEVPATRPRQTRRASSNLSEGTRFAQHLA